MTLYIRYVGGQEEYLSAYRVIVADDHSRLIFFGTPQSDPVEIGGGAVVQVYLPGLANAIRTYKLTGAV